MIQTIYSQGEVPFSVSNWHSDVTFASRPPIGSILLARAAPPVGGDTMFCDAYAMYEGLSPKLKEQLEGLEAFHQGDPFAHGIVGQDAVHPILRTHPETGRTTLYMGAPFTKRIVGMEPEESQALMDRLRLESGRPECCCRFRWEDGSMAMWDNRACQHYGVGDFWPYKRLMERVTILDYNEEAKRPYYQPGRIVERAAVAKL